MARRSTKEGRKGQEKIEGCERKDGRRHRGRKEGGRRNGDGGGKERRNGEINEREMREKAKN